MSDYSLNYLIDRIRNIMLDNPMNIVAAVLGGYFVTSMILLRHPTLIHRRKKIRFTCRHISHRGGAGESYENTLTAFRRAVALGTDMLELDCQLTKDKQVVISHDNNLFRCTGVDKDIRDLDFKDLPLLKPNLPVDFDPGVTFMGSGTEEERKIPLLSEAFKLFPTIPINIDIKTNDDILIKEVDKLIKSHQREDLTIWGNMTDEITQKCYLQNPRVNLLFSFRRVIQLLLLFYTGLLPFVPIKETHLEIFRPSMYKRPAWSLHKKNEGVPFLVSWPSFFVHLIDVLVMRKSLFQHLNRRGIQTYIWVLNYESEFKDVFELGITGIMTDYPSRLCKFLQENPQFRLTNAPLVK